MICRILISLVFYFSGSIAFSQSYTNNMYVNYKLEIDTSDLTGYNVVIEINNAPSVFHLAMATHHEYDDRYWRFINNFKAGPGKTNFIRKDSSLWEISTKEKNVAISYRLQMPSMTGNSRPAWRPFLSSNGGLVGDMHSFMYIVEKPGMQVNIYFKIPGDWKIATGLTSTKIPNTFYANSAKMLLDCPVMVGKFSEWHFTVKGIPHKVVYWPSSNAKMPGNDTTLLVNNIKKIAQQVIDLFGEVPYANYTFLFRSDSYGALEHSNSVTIGLPAETFQRDIADNYNEIIHEYFHTWNLMALKPAEYSDLNYGPNEKAKGLWWSEGLSLFYADVIARRAGLPIEDSDRLAHLKHLIERYYWNPGNAKVSPENTSLVSNSTPDESGDYLLSVHLQGEIIGSMLDLIIRNTTNGKSSMDDLMREVFSKFSSKGFNDKNIQQTAELICHCDLKSFFEKYVYNGNEMRFNEYLKVMGKQITLTWKEAMDNGKPTPDLTMFSWTKPGESIVRVGLSRPESCWGRAGLHTGDKLISVNSIPIKTRDDYFQIIRNIKTGDVVLIEVEQNGIVKKIKIPVTSYKIPEVQVSSLPLISAKQQKIFLSWALSK